MVDHKTFPTPPPTSPALPERVAPLTSSTTTTTTTTTTTRQTVVVHSPSALQAQLIAARAAGTTIGFVPTMGALHAGHAALLNEARRRAEIVVLSIFVNPTQFNVADDLAKYPRTLDADVEIARHSGVDIVFAPSADEMYPPGFDTKLIAGRLGADLEGADRPGHFDGVITVVNLLLSIVQPHFAVFGEKDYQQLQLVQRMTQDLRMPTAILAMPVIREADGVAMSSRNTRLSLTARLQARGLSLGLAAASDALQRGERNAGRLEALATATLLTAAPDAQLHYVAVRDAQDLLPVDHVDAAARLLIAATIGGVRLIDNGALVTGADHPDAVAVPDG